MKCKHCNGIGKIRGYFYEKTGVNKWEKVWGDSPCDECNGTGEIQQTEQEYIQTCTTEQLAEWIVSEINERVKLALHDSELNDGDVDDDFYMEDSDDWKEWLKQPHTPKE